MHACYIFTLDMADIIEWHIIRTESKEIRLVLSKTKKMMYKKTKEGEIVQLGNVYRIKEYNKPGKVQVPLQI